MFPFTLRQLEIFSALCETGSFVETSHKFGISQPSVSNQIQTLENQLGFDLFIRERGKPPKLSLEGEIFKKDADKFIEMGKILSSHRKSKIKPLNRPIRIYIGSHIFEDFFRPSLTEFYYNHPEIELEFITEIKPNHLDKEIKSGRIDLVCFIWFDTPFTEGFKQLATISTGIYAHKSLVNRVINDDEISKLPFILPSVGSSYATGVVTCLKNEGIFPTQVVLRSQHQDVWRETLSSGKGALFSVNTIMSKLNCEEIVLVKKLKDWHQVLYINPNLEKEKSQAVEDWVLSCFEAAKIAADNCLFAKI